MGFGIDLRDEQLKTAMTSPTHLKAWMRATDRNFLVFQTEDIVDGLEWPGGIEALQQIVTGYRDYRRTKPTAWTEEVIARDALGQSVKVRAPINHDEDLDPDEWDVLIEWAKERKAEAVLARSKRRDVRRATP